MDILILVIGMAFLGLIGIGVYIFLKEPQQKNPLDMTVKNEEAELIPQFHKKISACEEKIKSLEYNLEATSLELTQTKEKEKALLKEKSAVTFDSEQYEKFKKEFQTLKGELSGKEEMLEKEISQRRKESSELAELKAESDALKKKTIESEDAYRKAQAAIETLTKELALARKTIDEQKRVVKEHSENKKEGEWVSRIEFNKIENELKEKEAMIQKFLSLKKDPPSAP